MGDRLNCYFESRLKLDPFCQNYIYSERGIFAASFHNKNSLLMLFKNSRFLEGGRFKHLAIYFSSKKQSLESMIRRRN